VYLPVHRYSPELSALLVVFSVGSADGFRREQWLESSTRWMSRAVSSQESTPTVKVFISSLQAQSPGTDHIDIGSTATNVGTG
jgi:hypothetical protein